MKKIFFAVFALFTLIPFLMAQDKGAEAAGGMTTILQQGGNTLLVLLVMSVFFVTMSLFLLMTLRNEVMAPKGFLQDAEAAAKDKDLEALKVICANSNSPAARIIGAATEEIVINPDVSYNAVRDSVEDEGNRQAGNIYQKVQYIMDIAVVAPMIGLLGTVLGMREAFSGLRVDIGSSNPVNLADGVSKALITTAAGLILGITAMVVHSYFRGKVHNLLSGLENSCGRILRVFAKQGQQDSE